MNSQIALVAAKWWADKLRNPDLGSFNMGSRLAVYEQSAKRGLAFAQDNPAEEKNLKRFETMLCHKIAKEMTKREQFYLMCDYHPDDTLYGIAYECGINEALFPWKTIMTVRQDTVTVRCGYDAPVEKIFP